MLRKIFTVSWLAMCLVLAAPAGAAKLVASGGDGYIDAIHARTHTVIIDSKAYRLDDHAQYRGVHGMKDLTIGMHVRFHYLPSNGLGAAPMILSIIVPHSP